MKNFVEFSNCQLKNIRGTYFLACFVAEVLLLSRNLGLSPILENFSQK